VGEVRIRTLTRLSDIGFRHIIGGGYVSNFRNAADAEAASNAVHVLEGHTPPIEGIDDDDSRYDTSWYRQTSIWDKWPNDRGSPVDSPRLCGAFSGRFRKSRRKSQA
jgi:hypothetical protein